MEVSGACRFGKHEAPALTQRKWRLLPYMPKRTDLKFILVIGSGPIVIGQACEFDYSGTQACRALKEEGYRVVLVNSNPATIMTDPDLVAATYLEPITAELTYGLLRICLYLQNVDSVMDINWGGGVSWAEINRQAEKEFSAFHFESANTDLYFELFRSFEAEARAMLEGGLVLPAYDYAVKLSHIFNIFHK